MIKASQAAQLRVKPPVYSKLIYPNVQKFKLPLLLTILHIPLGLLLYRSSALALFHPLLTFFLGLYFAVRKHERLERVAYLAAYIVGSEVLWRMAQSPIPWEFGKYSVSIIMIVALIQRGYWNIPTPPLFYLGFLIPACLLTLMINNLADSRSQLSFNMSGPLLLFISCWFFSHLKINIPRLRRLLLMIVIPLVSVAVTALFYTFTIEDIEFGTESNIETSGGFGPNQVSSMLGLGVFVCLVSYLLFKNKFEDKIYLSLLTLLFATQSVLTFSRGGMYNAIGGILFVVFFQMTNPFQNLRRLLAVFGVGIIFVVLIFPSLNDFTDGALQARFEDTESTGRVDIVNADFQIFLENPLLGVGVGEAIPLRRDYVGKKVVSHTEFARVISEHGLFGIIALFVLALGSIYAVLHHKLSIGRALAVGAIVWSSLFMMNAGMRTAAPSFIWGLSFLTILTPQIRRKVLPNSSKNIR